MNFKSFRPGYIFAAVFFLCGLLAVGGVVFWQYFAQPAGEVVVTSTGQPVVPSGNADVANVEERVVNGDTGAVTLPAKPSGTPTLQGGALPPREATTPSGVIMSAAPSVLTPGQGGYALKIHQARKYTPQLKSDYNAATYYEAGVPMWCEKDVCNTTIWPDYRFLNSDQSVLVVYAEVENRGFNTITFNPDDMMRFVSEGQYFKSYPNMSSAGDWSAGRKISPLSSEKVSIIVKIPNESQKIDMLFGASLNQLTSGAELNFDAGTLMLLQR